MQCHPPQDKRTTIFLFGCSVPDGGGVDDDGRNDGGAVTLLQGGRGSALLHGIQDLVSGEASPGGCTVGCGGAGSGGRGGRASKVLEE